MKASWKQTPLEQSKKRSPALDQAKQIAELKAEISRMHARTADLKLKNDALNDACGRWRALADEYEADRDRYKTLRELDVMVMDKDGAKYLKGEELDKYIDEHHGVRLRAGVYQRISKQYQQALAASMAQTKAEMANSILQQKYIHKTYTLGIDYGLDTGS